MKFFLNFQKQFIVLSILYLLHAHIYAQKEKAESFFLYDFDENEFYLSEELNKGKPIFINFFATWCGPCWAELPLIEELKNKNPNVSFFIVHVDNLYQNNIKMEEPERKKVLELLEERGVFFSNNRLLYDKYAVAAEKYNIITLPESYLISKNGFIVSSYKLIDESIVAQIQREIDRL